MPPPAEMVVRTLYRPDGSISWAGDLNQIREDRKAMDCGLCSEVTSEPKILFVKTSNISRPMIKQIEAQAADKGS